MFKDWSDLMRANFAVILLSLLFVGLLAFTLHMSHDGMDKDLVSWGRESCNAVLGAILLCLRGTTSNQQNQPPPTLPANPQEKGVN